MSLDFSEILKSKRGLRERLAALPISEKLRMLDSMRECVASIRASKRAQGPRVREQPREKP
jgi:hypothetical protein